MSLLFEHFVLLHIYLHINTEPPELPPPGIHSDVSVHALNVKKKKACLIIILLTLIMTMSHS